MTLLEMKTIARRVFEEGWNKGNYAVVDELHTPDCVLVDPNFPVEGRGPDAVKSYAKAIRAAFPDIEFRIEDQVAEGNEVVNFIRITGTQSGEFLHVPASNKKATVTCFCRQRFEGGKIAHITNLWDALGFMRASGALERLEKPAFATR